MPRPAAPSRKRPSTRRRATAEDAPVSLFHDSPYSISKLIGEMYGNYYFSRYGLPFVRARFQNVYGPGEILGAGRWRGTPHTVWRNVTPTFVWKALHREALPVENGGIASRDFIFVEDIARGLIACAERGAPGRGLQSRLRRRDDDPRSRATDQRADRQSDADRAGARRATGTARAAASAIRGRRARSSGFPPRQRCATASSRRSRGRGPTRDTIRRCMLQHARFVPGLRAALG